MDKKIVIDYLSEKISPKKAVIAEKLGYADRNCIYNWPDPIPQGTMKSVVMRMRATGIKVPRDWRG